MKKKLTTKEVEIINRIADKLWKIREKYNKENGTDIKLQIEENGTIGECLDIATAALETILQEY